MTPEPVIERDGSILIGDERLVVPNLQVESRLGSGANGFVFRARNPYVDRYVAVKIWTALREKDSRDKFEQGMAEARKAVAAAGPDVVAIYDAGELRAFKVGAGEPGRYFYASMEYFPSVTLEAWLDQQRPSVGTRWRVARRLIHVLERTSESGLHHGDMHTKDILIGEAPVDELGLPAREQSIRVIDFGTSLFSVRQRLFSVRQRSIARHWNVVNETFRRLLHPLDINRLTPVPRLADEMDPSAVLIRWYWDFLAVIPFMLVGAGAKHLRPPEFDNALLDEGAQEVTTDSVRSELNRVISSGALQLTLEGIGRPGDYEIWEARLPRWTEESLKIRREVEEIHRMWLEGDRRNNNH